MGETVNVAVVRASDRKTAASRALALIADDLKGLASGADILIKPNLVSHKTQLPSTHVETLTSALDAVIAAGGRRVTIAEGASDAPAAFDRFGFRRAAEGRDVRFFDINREEEEWEPLRLVGIDGRSLFARVSRTVTGSPCRVSLALAKTHVTAILTLSLKNMLSSIHPDDRMMMHGHSGGGNGYTGWRRLAVEFLKQDHRAVNMLTRTLGRVRNARNAWRSWCCQGDPFHALTKAELGYLRSVEAMNQNLAALARKTRPHVSVVDGFLGMHREGPRHGTPIRLGTVIAGTDPVAVDAVAAAVMGFDPRQIGYLVYAEQAGIGTADLDRINIVGDPIARVRRSCVPHSNHAVQRHWQRLSAATGRRGPHFAVHAAERVAS